MIKIRVPATSANMGPGFDCLGCALTIYNQFQVEESSSLRIEGVLPQYANQDNLFNVAYQKVMQKIGSTSYPHVIFEETNVPISRGMGSSATLICAGAFSANALHGNPLSTDEIFKICTDIEGHPDNIAPALFGCVTISITDGDKLIHQVLSLNACWHFTVLIPDFEVSTSKARSILPSTYSREDAVYNIAHAVSLVKALESDNEELLKASCIDKIHQPYRKELIPQYDLLKDHCLNQGAAAFMISGSGSTCLVISKDASFSKKLSLSNFENNWNAIDCKLDTQGTILLGDNDNA